MEPVIIGTEVKFAVNISAEGFSMEDDDFVISLLKGRNVVKEYSKTDLVLDFDGTYLLCIDTTEVGVGSFDIAVMAKIPDTHFEDGFRTEIERVELMTVKKL